MVWVRSNSKKSRVGFDRVDQLDLLIAGERRYAGRGREHFLAFALYIRHSDAIRAAQMRIESRQRAIDEINNAGLVRPRPVRPGG